MKQSLVALALLAIAAGTLAFFVSPVNSEAIIVAQVRKSVDQTITDVLQNDTALVVPLIKNRTYIIDGSFFVDSDLTGSCGIAFEFPGDANVAIGIRAHDIEGNAVIRTSGEELNLGGCDNNSGEALVVSVSGTVVMGATDGNLQTQWNAVDAGNTITVEAGSWLRADKL